MALETIHWHTVHPRFIDSNSIVLDLGANVGCFSKLMVERFNCTCISVEPTPSLMSCIPTDPRITKLGLAIAEKDGSAKFHISSQSTSSSLTNPGKKVIETIDVSTRNLESLVNELNHDIIDVIKFDIEGAEIGVLASCSDTFLKQRVKQITAEFHDFNGITPPSEVTKTIERLRALGFYGVRMSRVGHQDTWLINRNLCEISYSECLWNHIVLRNWFGAKRVMERWLKRTR